MCQVAMVENVKLCVLMSIYKNDRLDFIMESVNSLLGQTYKLFHLYIKFDGPVSDGISLFLDSLKDERIYLYKREENKGLARSLNELITLAKKSEFEYEYYARMDADDISLAARFDKQISFLKAHKEIDCVGSFADEILENGEFFMKKEMPLTHQECFNFFSKRDCIIHPSVMFRKTYFDKAGLYPEDTYFAEDTMMWAKGFYNHCMFANYPEVLLKFRLDRYFFLRRRGIWHARSILLLRFKVNRILKFGFLSYFYAVLYAFVKLLPASLLIRIYKLR